MLRTLGLGVAALLAAAAAVVLWAYLELTTLDHRSLTEDLSLVRAGGINGNVGVLRTGEGAVIVDTLTFRFQGARLRELAERLAGGPVQAVINTHYHLDHTHGNPGFPVGTRIVATERTLRHMLERDAGYWDGARSGSVPNDVFDHERELRIGGKTIRVFHPGRGHTDGDLGVLFVEDRVLHLGDLLFAGCYPSIDLEAGGSIEAWIETLDRVQTLDFDRVIPGHGPVADREEIRAFQGFLRELWELGQRAAREKLSLGQTRELAERMLKGDAGFLELGIPLFFRIDRDFVVRRAFEEATRGRAGGS